MSRIIRITESQLRNFIMESLEEDIVKKFKANDNGTTEYWFNDDVTEKEVDDRINSDDKKRIERSETNKKIETKSLQDRLKDKDEVAKAKRRVAISKALRNQKELDFGD